MTDVIEQATACKQKLDPTNRELLDLGFSPETAEQISRNPFLTVRFLADRYRQRRKPPAPACDKYLTGCECAHCASFDALLHLRWKAMPSLRGAA